MLKAGSLRPNTRTPAHGSRLAAGASFAGDPPTTTAQRPTPHNRIFSGGQSDVDPPVPIPNTEVKRVSADDTGGAILCGK